MPRTRRIVLNSACRPLIRVVSRFLITAVRDSRLVLLASVPSSSSPAMSSRVLLLAALVVLAIAVPGYSQGITKLPNGPPTRYTITNTSNWPALGGAFFFGPNTTEGVSIGGAPGLLVTNNSLNQVGFSGFSSGVMVWTAIDVSTFGERTDWPLSRPRSLVVPFTAGLTKKSGF